MNSLNKTGFPERKFPALRNLKNDIYIATNWTNTEHWLMFPQYFKNQYAQDITYLNVYLHIFLFSFFSPTPSQHWIYVFQQHVSQCLTAGKTG